MDHSSLTPTAFPRRCPRCRGHYVSRSRSTLRRWLRLLKLRFYRCGDCDHRFLGLVNR